MAQIPVKSAAWAMALAELAEQRAHQGDVVLGHAERAHPDRVDQVVVVR